MSFLAKPLEQAYWEKKNPLLRVGDEIKQAEKLYDAEKREKLTDSEIVDEVIDQTQAWGGILPGGAVMAQVANMAQFGKDVFENGMGHDLSEGDRIERIRREIDQNKADIYEKTEDQEERWQILSDVLKQYQEENSELWPKILEELREKKTIPKSLLD